MNTPTINYTNVDIFNVMEELMYICDTDTNEVLYMNEAAKNTFPDAFTSGKKCYELFHDRTSPCENCRKTSEAPNNICRWICFHENQQKYYQHKIKPILFDGHMAILEAAIDITEQINHASELSDALNTEKFVTEQVARLSAATDLSKALNEMLAAIGSHMGADRAYIFILSEDTCSNLYEWCAKGVTPEIDNLQNIPLSNILHWTKELEKSNCILVKNIEDIAETNPEEYAILKEQDITSCVEAPIMRGDRLIGFVGVDNAPEEMNAKIQYLLKTMGYFISIVLQNAEQKAQLENLSFEDGMTSVFNRNAYGRQLINLKKNYTDKPVGFVLCDLNGLKQINDQHGHHIGDLAIIGLANTLKTFYSVDTIYRIGGDEFAVILPGIDEQTFIEKLESLFSFLEKNTEFSVSVGNTWCPACYDAEDLMQLTDRKMYHNKQQYYKNMSK